MNKTLIELMLEANVEWPDGAEFAAQDKLYSRLWFYIDEPELREGRSFWSASDNYLDFEVLTEIASDWSTTIITRAEYEAAQDKAERDRIFGYKDEPCESAKVSIEDKLLKLRVLKSSITERQLQLDNLNEQSEILRTEIAADLAALGWGERVVEPESVITDWRDLREGDIIECIGESWPDELINRLATVKRIDTSDDELGILAYYKNTCDWGCEFKFISRPSK